MNILITSAGRRVSLVKIFQKTVKAYDANGKVFTTDMDPSLSAACQISDGFLEVPRVTDEAYIDILKSYCIENNISIIVPTIDTELEILSLVKENFMDANIFIAVSSTKICKAFYLKSLTEEFFQERGFDTPKILDDIEDCSYPIFAKLDNSSCSIGAEVVYTLEQARALARDKNYIFQEWISGDEYTVDVFINRKGDIVSVVPRLRIEVRAGEVSKAKTVKDREIIEEVKNLCLSLEGAYGCLTVQLFKSANRIVFIEINPRFGGGYPLSYLSDANFAKYLIEDFMGNDLKYDEDWKDNTIMLRYDKEVIVDGSSI